MLGHLDVYIRDVDKSVDARRELREIKLVCQMDMNGSRVLRDLHLLVSEGCDYSHIMTPFVTEEGN